MDPEKFVSLKNVGPEKKLGSEKIWVPKMLRVQKNLGPEISKNKKFGPHKIWVLKNSGTNEFLVTKKFVSRTNFDPKKFEPQKMLVPKILSWVGLGWQVQGSVSLVG